ncbi:lysyl-tRNA synthetase, putative [Theileria equi strain WA]|uniref:Lysine--tRNA ligase n=1 Tax=Theileria equi strain WA TaxID=1537102 RepID=L1LCI1_THEEQ|nr:lysyl-tRNA synthetase, putative [Theileria equi strain WA]EKX72863.1 lysyl-tRNA synthetase, putative [Theileria equi strain WA]|eukprot:XP_004832315.1 lysyl-tRNA synthetase, putative [Theileria equi strain WA]
MAGESTEEVDPRHYFQNRLDVVQEWRKNKTAYPHKFQTTMSIKDYISKYENLAAGEHDDSVVVSLAGRVSRIASSSSKLRFLDLKSEGYKLQVFANFANHDPETGDFNEIYNNIKRGDIVGFTGYPGKSKRGELSIFPKTAKILTPCLHMLPDKFRLKDQEVRFRQRYLDFIINDDSIKVMKIRSRIIEFFRSFFTKRGFFEVETPMLKVTSTGASAKPFITHHNELDLDLFMRIAPELPLKMIIIGGFEKVFEIGKCFRNEGIDPTHNPEFTSCEFYWAYADYNDLMTLTEELLSSLVFELHGTHQIPFHPDGPEGPEVIVDFSAPFSRVSYVDELEDKLKTKLTVPYDSPENCEKYIKAIKEEGLDMPHPPLPAKLLDQLVGHFIEDRIVKPTFIIDYPQCTSPLAKWHRERDNVCERFELFVCGKELANAYTELNDPIVQRDFFKEQQKTDIDHVTGFVALTHSLKEGGTFTLSNKLDNNERLEGGGDILGVEKVSVYYWDGDTEYTKPLLLEVIKSGGPPNVEYYYRYESGERELGDKNDEKVWKYQGHSGGLSLQTLLDDRNLARNRVIPFNIGDPTKPFNFDSASSKGKRIKSNEPPTTLSGSDYTAKTYKIADQNLKLSRVENDKKKLDIPIPHDTLEGIKLYSSPVNPNVPLMFELKSSNGGKSTFYTTKEENGKNSWTEVGYSKSRDFYSGGKDNLKPTDKLSEQLDEVLCSKGYVTIDLSHSRSTRGQPYCCDDHKEEKRVTVSRVSDPSGSSHITFYKHEIKNGYGFAGIYYKTDSGERKSIKISGLKSSASDSVKLYTFYDGRIPKLIFVESTEQPNVKGWYKGGTADEWTKVLNAPSESPDEVKADKDREFEKYVKVLKCKIYGTDGTCSDTAAQSLSQTQGGAGALGSDGPDGGGGATGQLGGETNGVTGDRDATNHDAAGPQGLTGPPGPAGRPGSRVTGEEDGASGAGGGLGGRDQISSRGSREFGGLLGSFDWSSLTSKFRDFAGGVVDPLIKLRSAIDSLPGQVGIEVANAAHNLIYVLAETANPNKNGTALTEGGEKSTQGATSDAGDPGDREESSHDASGSSVDSDARDSDREDFRAKDPVVPKPPEEPPGHVVKPKADGKTQDEDVSDKELDSGTSTDGKAEKLGAEAGITAAAGSVLWTAFGSTSGTLAGAGGLTGFTYWMYKRLKGDPWAKDLGDAEAQPPDESFCTALEYGLPPTAGWGMGIDRLTMFMADKNNIKEVIFFPTMRPVSAPAQAPPNPQ